MGNSPHLTPRVPDIESFGTVLECMDGRPLRKVADYLTASFGVRNLDTITTAGMVRHLAEETDQTATILANVDLSKVSHGSRQIAVVAHHDCAGNPTSDGTQKQQLASALSRLRERHPDCEVIGLWLNEHWIVEKVVPA